MPDATARFDLEVNAKATGLDEANAAGAKLQATIAADTKALNDLQKQMKLLQGGTKVDIATQKALQSQIDAKKASLAGNVDAMVKLGVTQEKGTKSAGDLANAAGAAAEGLGEVGGAATAIGGPVGGLVGRAQQLVGALGKAGVAGAAIAAAAVIAVLLGVVIAATVALASFALSCADAARSAGILREGATGSAAGAERLGAEVARLAGRIATPRAEIEQLALALARSGLQGNALETALSAIATTSAVMGQAAGGALQGIIERSRLAKRFLVGALDLQGTGIKIQDIAAAVAKRMGVSAQTALAALQNGQIRLADGIAALDDVVMRKFGPLAARQMLALPTQVLKAKEALTAMFAGVRIEGFLGALHGVLSLLDENTVSGKALKAIVETLLNPLFDAIAASGPYARAFFQGLIIGALILAINVQKLRNAWDEAFGGSATSKIFTLENALKAGEVAFKVVLGVVLILTAALAVLAIIIALVALPFVLAGVAAYLAFTGIVAGVEWVADAVSQLYTNLSGVVDGFVDAGEQAVDGFIKSLVGGNSAAAEAAKGLAKAALGGMVGALLISSPSRATGQLARYTHQGFTNEIEAAEPAVQASMASTFAPPDPGSGAAAGGALAKGGGGGGGQSIEVHFHGDVYIGSRKALKGPQLEADMADLFRRAAQRAGLKS
jgi:hypothetical protein